MTTSTRIAATLSPQQLYETRAALGANTLLLTELAVTAPRDVAGRIAQRLRDNAATLRRLPGDISLVRRVRL